SHAYDAPGTYTITLYAINGSCSTSTTQQIIIRGPIPNYTFSINCSNRLEVIFTNTSVGATTSTWDFDDGSTSTATNPTHTYAAYGTYHVNLLIYDAVTGYTNEITKNVRIFPLDVDFYVDDSTICEGETVYYHTTKPFGYTNFKWDFGDGSPILSTGAPNVSHVFPNQGTYDTKLIVTDKFGCKDSLVKLNHINVQGVAVNFTALPPTGCIPLTVNFTDLSVSSGGAIATRLWNFGNGQTLGGNVS